MNCWMFILKRLIGIHTDTNVGILDDNIFNNDFFIMGSDPIVSHK